METIMKLAILILISFVFSSCTKMPRTPGKENWSATVQKREAKIDQANSTLNENLTKLRTDQLNSRDTTINKIQEEIPENLEKK